MFTHTYTIHLSSYSTIHFTVAEDSADKCKNQFSQLHHPTSLCGSRVVSCPAGICVIPPAGPGSAPGVSSHLAVIGVAPQGRNVKIRCPHRINLLLTMWQFSSKLLLEIETSTRSPRMSPDPCPTNLFSIITQSLWPLLRTAHGLQNEKLHAQPQHVLHHDSHMTLGPSYTHLWTTPQDVLPVCNMSFSAHWGQFAFGFRSMTIDSDFIPGTQQFATNHPSACWGPQSDKDYDLQNGAISKWLVIVSIKSQVKLVLSVYWTPAA